MVSLYLALTLSLHCLIKGNICKVSMWLASLPQQRITKTVHILTSRVNLTEFNRLYHKKFNEWYISVEISKLKYTAIRIKIINHQLSLT